MEYDGISRFGFHEPNKDVSFFVMRKYVTKHTTLVKN